MAGKKADSWFRTSVARDLDALAEILSREMVVKDISPIRKASNECRTYGDAGKWKYSIENLTFRGLGAFKVFQPDFDLQDAILQLSVIVEGRCEDTENKDPLTSLAFHVSIEGDYMNDSEVRKARSAWHLDRHSETEALEFAHPVYHLSFGGMFLQNLLDRNTESVLLADTPRFVHPPLDAFLGVDLIATNFLGKSLSKFRTDGEYVQIIKRWQEKLWKPYAYALQGYWEPNTHTLNWQPSEIWPQLMPL